MNARIVVVLVVLLAVLGGGALLVQRQEGAGQKPADAGSIGQPLLKGLQGAQVAALVIREPKKTLTIQKKDDRWGLVEYEGYPADVDKVRDFVLKALELKIAQAEPIGDKDRARLQLDAEGGTTIEFQGADGKPLASLIAGKKYFKSEPENPAKALGDGRFVMLPADPKRVLLISNPLAQASTKSADWVSKAGIAAEKVKTLEVRPTDGPAWKIERSGDNADWKLVGAGGGEKLEITKANAASYTMSLIEVADVAPKGIQASETGLDKPTLVTATTLDGLVYVLRVGKLVDGNYYAAVSVSGDPKPEGKDGEERLKKINERLPREKALSNYVVLIPKGKLDDILKKRADLLEKKEPAKK